MITMSMPKQYPSLTTIKSQIRTTMKNTLSDITSIKNSFALLQKTNSKAKSDGVFSADLLQATRLLGEDFEDKLKGKNGQREILAPMRITQYKISRKPNKMEVHSLKLLNNSDLFEQGFYDKKCESFINDMPVERTFTNQLISASKLDARRFANDLISTSKVVDSFVFYSVHENFIFNDIKLLRKNLENIETNIKSSADGLDEGLLKNHLTEYSYFALVSNKEINRCVEKIKSDVGVSHLNQKHDVLANSIG